jgi:RNA polymerase sigma-70 factor (ECF subfamily)
MKSSALEITRLLKRWSEGDRDAVDSLINATYDEMRRVARGYFRRERLDHTLQPTALVHEAYLRLFHGAPVALDSRESFFRLVASRMRRQLVDHARRHNADKRGGGKKASLDDVAGVMPAAGGEVAAFRLDTLDAALTRLATDYPRVSAIVQRRYFGDQSLEEVATAVGVSLATVKRDLAFARAWLARELVGR